MASLIGRALALRNAGPPVRLGGGAGWSKTPGMLMGGDNDEDNMRAYSTQGTVFANVSLLASSTAAPEWKLYKKQPQDGRRRYTTNDQGSDQRTEVTKHQALTVLTTPASIIVNGTERVIWSRFALFELSQIWMETTGKSYWVVQRDPRANFPTGLWPVRPDRLQPVPDADNFLAGWIYTAPDGRERVPLQVDEIIFNRYPDPLDLYGGCGPIQSVLTDIDSSRYAAEWNRNYFINSAEPGGVIEVEENLDDNEWRQLTDRWREGHRGVARAHRVAVLEGGQKWVPNMHTMKDMDFAALRMVGRDIVREALGMHKVMTGVTDDVNRANAQTGEEVFASWKIKPRLDRWKDVINTQFLPLFGATADDVEFDYSFPMPLNREQDNAELTAKAAAALTLVQAGFDPHDALEVVGLPDMDVAEQATQQTALPPGWVAGGGDGSSPGAPGQGSPDAGDGDSPASNRRLPALMAKKDAAEQVFEQAAEDFPPTAMAWMHHATWMGPVKVPLDHIDPKMPWMDGADPDHVQDFVKRLKAGKKLKPVILVKTPAAPKLKLVDGHHRWLASAEMDEPPRAFIATVDAEHGEWEDMHALQLPRDGGGDSGDASARIGRLLARAGGRDVAALNYTRSRR